MNEDKRAYKTPEFKNYGTISAMTKTYGEYGGDTGYDKGEHSNHDGPHHDGCGCWNKCDNGIS